MTIPLSNCAVFASVDEQVAARLLRFPEDITRLARTM
jgi:hypothetical protein